MSTEHNPDAFIGGIQLGRPWEFLIGATKALQWHIVRVSEPSLPQGFKVANSDPNRHPTFLFDRHRTSLLVQLPTLPSHLVPHIPHTLCTPVASTPYHLTTPPTSALHSDAMPATSCSNCLFCNIFPVSSGPNVTKYCFFSCYR